MQTFIDLPTGPERDRALRDGYLKWVRSKGSDAIDWMPADAANDKRYAPIIGMYAIALARRPQKDPVEQIKVAAAWIDGVEDDTLRRNTSIQLGAIWIQLDPEVAQKWIEERNLAGEVEATKRQARAVQAVQKARRASMPQRPGGR